MKTKRHPPSVARAVDRSVSRYNGRHSSQCPVGNYRAEEGSACGLMPILQPPHVVVCVLPRVGKGRKYSAVELGTRQLTQKDNWGMTLAMVAAESGMVPIIRAVLRRIKLAKVCPCGPPGADKPPHGQYLSDSFPSISPGVVFCDGVVLCDIITRCVVEQSERKH